MSDLLPFEWLIALRFLRDGRMQSLFIIAGVAIGVAVIVFMSALLTGGPMYLVNGGEQRRSFTHIDDASAGFETILLDPRANKQVFNIGNPANDVSIREMALLMQEVYAELTGQVVLTDLIDIDGEKFYGAGYEDHTRVPADISKLGALGWAPTRGLKETLRSVMGWYLDITSAMFASIDAS